jgi:hypothetical protein
LVSRCSSKRQAGASRHAWRTKKKPAALPAVLDIPVEALHGETLSVLVQATGPHLVSFGSGSERWDQPYLLVTAADGSTTKIAHIASDWQYLDSTRPAQAISDHSFGVSIGK